MPDDLYELTLVRERRRELEAMLPRTFRADELDGDQARAFDELLDCLRREQEFLSAWWAARGGSVLPGLRFREPPPRPRGRAPEAAREEVEAAWEQVLRAERPGTSWVVHATRRRAP